MVIQYFYHHTLEGTAMRGPLLLLFILSISPIWSGGSHESVSPGQQGAVPVTDSYGHELLVPADPASIICSGPGALRLAVYLQAEDRVTAADDMESRRSMFDARPYAMANPQFKELPLFGEFRGADNPELILGLDPQPQLMFKTFPDMGYDPADLSQKTGIPVVTLAYGDLADQRAAFYGSLRIMGEVLGEQERAAEVIEFFEQSLEDLTRRSEVSQLHGELTVYVGGIAFKGPHGIESTEPLYPPFEMLGLHNPAYDPRLPRSSQQNAMIAKEQLIMWDPDLLFLDVSTVHSPPSANALQQLADRTLYSGMQAVEQGQVYGLLPYNWYSQNFGSILANAYFIGTLIYPDTFGDIDPAVRADEIYQFLTGAPVFEQLNEAFGGYAFRAVSLGNGS